jgi:hypothetical protein
MPETPLSERTRVKRHPERGVYDRATIDGILDEALFCHVGYVADGHPRVIPTIHARVGDTLYVHGSNASRTLRTIKGGEEGASSPPCSTAWFWLARRSCTR